MKKRLYTLDEVRAWRIAYGKPIRNSEIFFTMVTPFFMLSIFVFALCYYWWAALIAGLVAIVYTYFFVLPQNEKRDYDLKSFDERNKFVNNMTQLLSNPEKTPLSCLKIAADRADGELKQELLSLQVSLMDARSEEIKMAYDAFAKKYANDVMFDLFVEQLTTATIEGCSNLETIKDVKSYHNAVKKKQKTFMQKKDREVFNYKFISVISFVLVLAISLSFGFEKFIEIYAHSIVGWICNSLYLALLSFFFISFRKRLIDDSVLEVKV